MNDKAKQTREGVEMNEMNIFKKKNQLYMKWLKRLGRGSLTWLIISILIMFNLPTGSCLPAEKKRMF